MPTYSALTTLPAKEPAEALAQAMEAFEPEPTGIGVFEIEDGSGRYEVGVYFEAEPDDTGLRLMAASHGARPFVVSEVPQTDWVAHVKRELRPVEAGRFFVYGSHDADSIPDGSVALLIEAAMAFGTGHHATTLGCLLALDRLDRAGFAAGTWRTSAAERRFWPWQPPRSGQTLSSPRILIRSPWRWRRSTSRRTRFRIGFGVSRRRVSTMPK